MLNKFILLGPVLKFTPGFLAQSLDDYRRKTLKDSQESGVKAKLKSPTQESG